MKNENTDIPRDVLEYHYMRYYLYVYAKKDVLLHTYSYKLDETHLMAQKIREISELSKKRSSLLMIVHYDSPC